MSHVLIEANPTTRRETKPGVDWLDVSEFFCDTIQGEGVGTGLPAAFLRLQGCTMNCVWCDTQSIHREGNPYTLDELFHLMDEADLIRKFDEGQILVITGGSPLKQQDRLVKFFQTFLRYYDFYPYTEIENECSIMPIPDLAPYINRWNNSPKLSNSGNPDFLRYQPRILSIMGAMDNGYFKFVIYDEADWLEIKRDFLDPHLLDRTQIILMPRGSCRDEMELNRGKVVEIAIRENVRYSSREHIALWDRRTSV